MIINNLQSLRGIAILMVVSLHLYGAELLYGSEGAILPSCCRFGAIGVDLFFVISGFIMTAITRGHFRSFRYMFRFLYSRFFRIFPLYWLCSIIFLLGLVIFKLGDPERIHNLDIFRSMFLLPQPQLPVLVVGWTLVHEIYFYIVFAVLLLFSEKYLMASLTLWAVVIIAAALIMHHFKIYPGATIKLILHPLTLEFIAGCMLARLINNGFNKYGKTVLALGFVMLPALCIFYGVKPYPRGWARLLFYGVPSLLIVYGAISLEFRKSFRISHTLEYIGNISYSMYLVHVPIILILGLLWSEFAKPGILDNMLAISLMLSAVFAASIVCYKLIEQPLRRRRHSFDITKFFFRNTQ